MLSYAFLVSTLGFLTILLILCERHQVNNGFRRENAPKLRIPIKRNCYQDRDEL